MLWERHEKTRELCSLHKEENSSSVLTSEIFLQIEHLKNPQTHPEKTENCVTAFESKMY